MRVGERVGCGGGGGACGGGSVIMNELRWI